MSSEPRAAPSRMERWTAATCDFAGVLLVAIAVLVNVEVVARGVFNTSTLIADEYSGYLFTWLTLLGLGYALQQGTFLRVEGLIERLPPRGRAWADFVSALVGLVVAAICTYSTALLVLSTYRFGTVSIQPSATPLWMPQAVLPVAFLVLVVIYGGLSLQAFGRATAKDARA